MTVVDKCEVMELPVSQPDATPHAPASPSDAAGRALKFAFGGGDRPLDGYTIKRGVGRGGFGEVYYAVSDAGKEVALKLIRRNLDVELRGVNHCLNLKHPNLVALYDVRQDDQDNSWVIMEFVGGESLEDVIRRHPAGMPPAEALDWIRGIAAGVGYLHNHGIVHRDLKPANAFRDEGIVKLGDYGLSKFISCSRRSGQTDSIGTVHYMAPEIANGRYGKEIDIYALGVMLYEMLVGRVPFEGESVGEVLMKHLTTAADLSALAEPYRTILARTLAKDPARRVASVDQFVALLPGAVAGAPRAHVAGAWVGSASTPIALASGAHAGSPNVAGEEPIWHYLRTRGAEAARYWNSGKLSTPMKIVVVLAGVLGLASNVAWLAPTLVTLVMVYAVYRGARAISRYFGLQGSALLPPGQGPAAMPSALSPAIPEAFQSRAPSPQSPLLSPQEFVLRGRKLQREQSVEPLLVKSGREQLADLAGSMLFAATVSAALGVVMVLLRGQPAQAEQYAWLTLVGTLGSWLILVPSKLWEGTKGEAALRRFVLLVLGLCLGLAGFALTRVLLVSLPFEIFERPLEQTHFPVGFYSRTDGAPLLYAYLAYFGFMFLIVRWWRQADPLRPERLSLWSTVSAVGAAWLINLLWRFPQPWGLMAAASISIAVQLASPWVPPRERIFDRRV